MSCPVCFEAGRREGIEAALAEAAVEAADRAALEGADEALRSALHHLQADGALDRRLLSEAFCKAAALIEAQQAEIRRLNALLDFNKAASMTDGEYVEKLKAARAALAATERKNIDPEEVRGILKGPTTVQRPAGVLYDKTDDWERRQDEKRAALKEGQR